MFIHRGVLAGEVFLYAVVYETCGAADVLFVVRSCNILFDRGAYLLKNSPVSEMRQFFLVHLRSVLFMLLERARRREYDL